MGKKVFLEIKSLLEYIILQKLTENLLNQYECFHLANAFDHVVVSFSILDPLPPFKLPWPGVVPFILDEAPLYLRLTFSDKL